MIYADNAATTQMSDAALQAMRRCTESNFPLDRRGAVRYTGPKSNTDLRGGVRFPTGGIAHKPSGMTR